MTSAVGDKTCDLRIRHANTRSSRKTYVSTSTQGKPLTLKKIWLVEAAGVEPASEKARRVKPTCVSGSAVSMSAYRTGKSGAHLVRLISALGSGPKPGAYPAK